METNTRVINTPQNSIQIVELQGRLDAHQGNQVDHLLAEAGRATRHTVVNLSKVQFIDSTGLSVLIKGIKHHREHQSHLVLCELQQPVRIIFELTRLDKMFTIYPTEHDALQAFNESCK
jgi:anti-sigma B factor antagonist